MLSYSKENHEYLSKLWRQAKERGLLLMYRGGAIPEEGDSQDESGNLRMLGLFTVLNPGSDIVKEEESDGDGN